MSRRSNVVRAAVAFLLGILLTLVAAFGGTFATMVLGGTLGCVLSFSSMPCSDFILAGLVFGTVFAAPCTVLLVPTFYILWGSRTGLSLFVIACAVLGAATMAGWEFAFVFTSKYHGVPGGDPLPAAAAFGGLVFGIFYFPIMRRIDNRLSPRRTANDARAAA